MYGILNINKPPGISSFSVVGEVRRLTRERRVGHAGTLDIPAGGVLPVAMGEATRVIEYLTDLPKVYLAAIVLGAITDTYDASGRIIEEGDASQVCREDVLEVLKLFQGEIEQVPPAYSALKYHGRRVSDWCREGMDIKLNTRKVHIYRLELASFNSPRLTIEVECGRGTYVRSLAFDIGKKLGCGAYLDSLVRTRYGPFFIVEAMDFQDLAAQRSQLKDLLYPMDVALEHLPPVILSSADIGQVRRGAPVQCNCAEVACESRLRAYDSEGKLVAILVKRDDGQWWPRKVFRC